MTREGRERVYDAGRGKGWAREESVRRTRAWELKAGGEWEGRRWMVLREEEEKKGRARGERHQNVKHQPQSPRPPPKGKAEVDRFIQQSSPAPDAMVHRARASVSSCI